MREQHPLDDLFSRALRDAEATPSNAVWEGIVQERGWAHMTLLQLRRRWGWMALLLLLGGSLGYLGIHHAGEKGARLVGAESATSDTVAPNALLAISYPGAMNSSFDGSAKENPGASKSIAANDPEPTASATAAQPPQSAVEAERGSRLTAPHKLQKPRGRSKEAPLTSTLAVASGAGKTLSASAQQVGLTFHEGPVTESTSRARSEALPKASDGSTTSYDREDQSEVSVLGNGPIGWLSTRSMGTACGPLQAMPQNAPPPSFVGPRNAWWVGVTVGQYRETRTWHGGDAQLVNALQGTEAPHRTTNFGVLAGLEWRKGWGFATGIEYGAARYDFQHFDQFRSTRDSLVTHVITFNTQVLDSYVDTVSTSTEVRRTVAAVNRYTTLRVPLEGSWHRAWRRWHVGLRGSVAVEFNTMRSGVTLMSGDGGTRSVEVTSTEKQKATLVSGGLAVDVGYAITERLGLWASPGYAAGLLSLSPTDGSPYAMPERLGIRLRLAYTLRPGR